MPLEDKVLKCRECGVDFIFSVGEQEFFQERGFEHEPTRCRDCRARRRNQGSEERAPRELFAVTCASCGVETQVPFRPRNDRPVYCRECFDKVRA